MTHSANNIEDKKIIALIGMMGVGKTTIGAKLSEKLGIYFVDSDQEIEDREQKTIADIFDSKGEEYFRSTEKRIIEEIIARDEAMVLSLGGGAFVNDELRRLIKEKAVTIWLNADIETILYRIAGKNTRPLLNNNDRRTTLINLIKKRTPIYEQCNVKIDTDRESHESTVKKIIAAMGDLINDRSQENKGSSTNSDNYETVKVELGKKSYDILIGEKVVKQLPQRLSALNPRGYEKVFIVTDENVAANHLDNLKKILSAENIHAEAIILNAGEQSKSFAALEKLCEEILQKNIDRKSLLIAFGGGVIGDLCGFAASILLRGINFIQIPTTLLAMVDSSVGGKTAINSKFGKNLIGSFYQPKLVLCDLSFLQTLPQREFLAGYAEVFKYGLIRDVQFFNFLNDSIDKIKNQDLAIIKKMVSRSCQIKAEIVALDEKENDVRALLNFGHTFGHIFETETGYSSTLLHGEAVGIGMVMAAALSLKLKMICAEDFAKIKKHLHEIGLPTSPLNIRPEWNFENLISHLYKDKKVDKSHPTFILLERIGSATINKNVPKEDFLSIIHTSCTDLNRKK